MKWLILLLPLLFACDARGAATPEEAVQLDLLEAAEIEAEAEVARLEAVLADDPNNYPLQTQLYAAQGRLEEAQTKLAEFEVGVLRSRYGAFVAGIASIPIIGPYVTMLGPLGGALIPLVSRRGRKHFGNAIKNVNPFSKPPDGSTASNDFVSPVAAVQDLLKMVGVSHSSGTSKMAAEDPNAVVTSIPGTTVG